MQAADIATRIQEAALTKTQVYPCNNVRASEIGHPCERYLVLHITNWQDKIPHGADLQNIFDLGNAIETEAIRRVKDAGYEVLTARRNFKIEKPLITGREDIMMQDPEDGEMYPCEIKGLAPLTFDSIDTVADMLRHKRYYVRKYPAQLQVYMFHHNKERGFFILFNKISGRIKVIEMTLDYEYTESLLQKAERVYGHISAGTLPEPLEDTAICTDCPLLHVCGATIDRGESVIDNGDLEELLQRREALLPFTRELEDIKKRITDTIGDSDKVITASYLVSVSTVNRKSYTVPENSYRKQNIRRLC